MVLVTVRLPVWAPALVGTNSTPAVQLDPGASAAAQVSFTSSNPAGAARVRPLRVVAIPLLVMVTVVVLLVWPTPIGVRKSMLDGVTSIAAALAPVPLRITVAGIAMEGEVMLKVPVIGPVMEGAKTTPTSQLEFAGRLAIQVFCVSANPLVTDSAS